MHPLPHGYSHDTRGNGTTVVKRYASEAASRRETEHRMLTALTGRLPVPPALAAPPGELRLARVPGAPGFDPDRGGPCSCGAAYLRCHVAAGAGIGRGRRPARPVRERVRARTRRLRPDNMLFTADGRGVTALLDWEWAHAGRAVEDLAWCEWIVRRHLPVHTAALPHLFDGYGACPPWPDRQAAMLAKCRTMLAAPRPMAERAGARRRWTANIALTLSWNALTG